MREEKESGVINTEERKENYSLEQPPTSQSRVFNNNSYETNK